MDWYDSYNIGVEYLDEQHKDLVKTIDRLQKSLKSNNISAEMGETLKFLVNYTRHHFSEEEEFMLAINYPGYDSHKKLHQKLLNEVVEILVNIKKGKPINAYELIDFLVDWLKYHILNEDKRIAKCITAKKEKEKLVSVNRVEEVGKNISGKMEKIKEQRSKELITDSEYKEKISFILKDFAARQKIDNKKSLDEACGIVDAFAKKEFITADEAKDVKSAIAGKMSLEKGALI